METEKRQEAIFGAFDGTVSVIGFVFGLLVHHASRGSIAIGGLGGAIAAGVSMGSGEIEKSDGSWRSRMPVAFVMFCASLIGGLIPIWPFFVFSTGVAIIVAGIGCLIVATWIGYQKHKGWRGYAASFAILLCAAAITLAVVSVIPQSA
jgi:VIT1/CCC1 family predicted Fe2+/Mn2+ transporter